MPQIARQFRGVEDLLESTERKDTINFVGTDISPVINVDPGTLRLGELATELTTIVSPASIINFGTPAVGFYKQYLRLAIVHTDPTARATRIFIRDDPGLRNMTIFVDPLRPGGVEGIIRGGPIVPPFFMRGEVLALAVATTATMIGYVLTLPLGAPQPRNI